MAKLASKTSYLALGAFLCFAGVASAGPVSNVLATSPFAVLTVAMPEPSFPLEFGLTIAGFAGLVFLFRKRRIGQLENRSVSRSRAL
jgi:hypothetical protein